MLAFVEITRIVRRMERRTAYRRTTRYIWCCAAILAGLAWARWGGGLHIWWVIIAGVFALLSFRSARTVSLYVVVVFGLALGWWRGGLYMQEVAFLQSIERDRVVITGTVLEDGIYNDRAALQFTVGSLRLEAPEIRSLPGKIAVSGFGEKMVYRGDKIRVAGKFNPARGSVVARLNYAELEVVARSQSFAYKLTREFSAGMQSALPEPQASFGLGLLVGQRSTLPEQTADTLAAVGLTHIVAVSGYNLTILVRATKRLLARRSKFQSALGSITLVISFLLVTGASPSIVRASIISMLSLGAWYYGRTMKPMLLIVGTAAVTALWNPLYIWSDIGWYLSFLAFFGVLIIAPLFKQRFFPDREQRIVGELLLESFAAQLMTLPLILYIFHESSYVVLLANLVVVPFIPFAMLASFLAGVSGMLLPALAGWLAWPARYLLTYILDSAALVSRIPNMTFLHSLPLGGLIVMYTSICLVVFVWWRKVQKQAIITDSTSTNSIV